MIVTQVGGYRKVPAENWQRYSEKKAVRQRKPAKMWKKRLRKRWRQKEKTECYSVVGSLYLVGEIKTLILQGVGK